MTLVVLYYFLRKTASLYLINKIQINAIFPYLRCTFDATFYSSAIAAKPNSEAPPPHGDVTPSYFTSWYSGQYPHLSRGRPGFNSPSGSCYFKLVAAVPYYR